MLVGNFQVLVNGGAYGNGEVVAASELGDLADGAERGAHDDGLVAVLLVVVEDVADRLNTGVLLLGVLLLGGSLVPVKDAANKGRNEVGVRLSSGDGLDKREHEGQVGVDAVVPLQDLGGLDTLPCRRNLDENALLANSLLLVQLGEVRFTEIGGLIGGNTHVNDTEGLVDRGLCVEREAGVNLGGDLAGDNVEDLLAELDEEAVECGVDLVLDVVGVVLAPGNGGINELCVLGLLGSRKNQGGVGGRILGLVLVDGRKVTRVADDGLEGLLDAGLRGIWCCWASKSRRRGGAASSSGVVTYGASGLQLIEGGSHCECGCVIV